MYVCMYVYICLPACLPVLFLFFVVVDVVLFFVAEFLLMACSCCLPACMSVCMSACMSVMYVLLQYLYSTTVLSTERKCVCISMNIFHTTGTVFTRWNVISTIDYCSAQVITVHAGIDYNMVYCSDITLRIFMQYVHVIRS